MKNNSISKSTNLFLSAGLLLCSGSALLPGKVQASGNDPQTETAQIIEVYDIQGKHVSLELQHDCLQRDNIKQCFSGLKAPTPVDVNSELLRRLQTHSFFNQLSLAGNSYGQFIAYNTATNRSNTLAYIADFSLLPQWIINHKDLSSLTVTLHPYLLDQHLYKLNQSPDEEAQPGKTLYTIKPNEIPLSQDITNKIAEKGIQVTHIDLGDHYSMIMATGFEGHLKKIYLGDRLSNWYRSTKPWLLHAHGSVNFFELFHHIRELEHSAFAAKDMVSIPERRKGFDAIVTGAAISLHFPETFDHARQVHQAFFDTPLEENESSEQHWLERIHFGHSLFEMVLAYGRPIVHGNMDRFMRTASVFITLVNMLNDQIPPSWSEAHPDRLLQVFLEKELGISEDEYLALSSQPKQEL